VPVLPGASREGEIELPGTDDVPTFAL